MAIGREEVFFEEEKDIESRQDGGYVIFLGLQIPNIEEQDEGSKEKLLCGLDLTIELNFLGLANLKGVLFNFFP